MTFGERLKNARNSKKLTQRQLAEAISAKHNSISDWENDKNKPDPDTIELLCGVLEITPNYLLGIKGNQEDEITPFERSIIRKYRDLDDHGTEMVNMVLENEHKRWELDQEKAKVIPINKESNEHLQVNAAHERTDLEVTDEMRQHDDDLMDNDDLWK